METIGVEAVIYKLSTNQDGGYRLTLDISETDLAVAQELLRMKASSALIAIAFQEIKNQETK